jgi:RNA polymerase sigma factor (sigma-70 family)
MEPIDVEQALELLGPALRAKLVSCDQEDDYYQEASLQVLRDCQRYTCKESLDFMKLFSKHFYYNRQQDRGHVARERQQYKVFSLEDYCDSMGEYKLTQYSTDPREDSQMEAMEYIQLLPMVYRRVFMLSFIEGLDQAEVAQQLGITQGRVTQMIDEGGQWIRDELRMIEST